MCGISGLYNYSLKKIDAKSIIKKILKLQKLRGPDDEGIWQSNCDKVYFGHNRLSIIDLTKNGKQPFISLDKKFIITFNGEIYNFHEIKNELIDKKVKFKSNTDTEVIIESYKFWGIDFLKKLRGMFAFALWDLNKEKLILARDPFGIKPLYYSNKNGIYYFASQVKSLLSLDDISSNKSPAGVVNFYMWGNMQEPYTLYKDIKSIEKGTYSIINKDGSSSNFKFADIKNEIVNSDPINFKDKNEAISYLKNIVDETVSYHQVSDVPITFLLSSGVDSSTILASIKNKHNCSALTLDLDNKDFVTNEKLLATKTAYMNNIPHNIDKILDKDVVEISNTFYEKMDLPTNDGLNNYLISRAAKKNGSKVIISGVGGDEFFFGYPSFKRIPIMNNFLKYIPNINVIDDFLKSFFYNFLKKNVLNTKYSGIYDYGRNLETSFLLQRSLFLPHEIKEFLDPDIFKTGLEELNILENLKKDIYNIKEKKLSIMYLEIKYYLCSKLLNDSDWASMSHSIEMRTPFVDWFFFKKLVPLLKSNIKINKLSLLDVVKDKVPKELYNRKKTGFGIPHKSYLKKLSDNKIHYSHSIKDWSLFSYNKYLSSNIK